MKRATVLGLSILFIAALSTGALAASLVLNSAEDVAKAPVLKEEKLATFGSASINGPIFVLNPDGKTYDLLFSYCDYSNPDPGATLAAIDTAEGKATVIDMGKGMSPHATYLGHRLALPNGKLLMTVRNDRDVQMEIHEYDPATNTLRRIGCPSKKLGKAGAMPLALGEDGKVYGAAKAGHRQVGAYSYDLATEKFSYIGAIGPRRTGGGHSACSGLRQVGDYLYITSGKVPWHLIAFNLKTREEKVILKAPAGNRQIYFDGNVVKVRPDPKDRKNVVLYDLVDGAVVPLKRLEDSRYKRAPRKKLPRRPQLWKNLVVPRPDGTSAVAYRYRGAKEWKRVDFKVNTYPQKLWRLSTMRDGRLMGRAGSHLWSYIYDPKTDDATWLGTMFRLEQFAPALHHPNGLVYMPGYSGGPLMVYDPKKPWTVELAETGKNPLPIEDKASNPRLLLTYHELNKTRAFHGTALGADNNVYMGGRLIRDGNGGSFGWWDVDKSEAGVLPRETFYGFAVMDIGTAFGGEKIILSTHITFNEGTNKREDTAKIYVFDIRTKKILADYKPIPGADTFSRMIEVAPGKLLGAAMRVTRRQHHRKETRERPDVLFLFDLNKGEVVSSRELPAPLWAFPNGLRDGQHFVSGPDGWVWTYTGENRDKPILARIDPKTAEVHLLGYVDGLGPLAFVGHDLYRGCEHRAGSKGLRRLKNIVPAQ